MAFAMPSAAKFGSHGHNNVAVTALSYSVSNALAESQTGDDVSDASADALLVTPKFGDVQTQDRIKPVRILTQVRTRREYFGIDPEIRFTPSLQPNQRKVARPGVMGLRVVTERLTTWDSTVVDHQVLTRAVLRNPRRGVVLTGEPHTLSQLPLEFKYRRVATLITMVATAYTAGSASAWGNGYTATGLAARYGVVAVDPHVIPLGSHLFIPGYGYAIAADTGGAIIGNRVDLCMDSLINALNFGRQIVKVYILRR